MPRKKVKISKDSEQPNSSSSSSHSSISSSVEHLSASSSSSSLNTLSSLGSLSALSSSSSSSSSSASSSASSLSRSFNPPRIALYASRPSGTKPSGQKFPDLVEYQVTINKLMDKVEKIKADSVLSKQEKLNQLGEILAQLEMNDQQSYMMSSCGVAYPVNKTFFNCCRTFRVQELKLAVEIANDLNRESSYQQVMKQVGQTQTFTYIFTPVDNLLAAFNNQFRVKFGLWRAELLSLNEFPETDEELQALKNKLLEMKDNFTKLFKCAKRKISDEELQQWVQIYNSTMNNKKNAMDKNIKFAKAFAEAEAKMLKTSSLAFVQRSLSANAIPLSTNHKRKEPTQSKEDMGATKAGEEVNSSAPSTSSAEGGNTPAVVFRVPSLPLPTISRFYHEPSQPRIYNDTPTQEANTNTILSQSSAEDEENKEKLGL